ncbi:hypothetical protein [Sinimarinibacterium sp. NLF-5-8]|uniref:hypothetical protein n=1 Tax=Sinimarinibacterium sp. NLF-5-8 TaxID=2698684 RepID=UPI00137BFB87|nr:hypothetical protein [Sinimarinibacterium sp. NLF-5-8]QHS09007.1 hypothetical protein GT972_01850 [Sinimarinibacterium sp. NLF-5-8]
MNNQQTKAAEASTKEWLKTPAQNNTFILSCHPQSEPRHSARARLILQNNTYFVETFDPATKAEPKTHHAKTREELNTILLSIKQQSITKTSQQKYLSRIQCQTCAYSTSIPMDCDLAMNHPALKPAIHPITHHLCGGYWPKKIIAEQMEAKADICKAGGEVKSAAPTPTPPPSIPQLELF